MTTMEKSTAAVIGVTAAAGPPTPPHAATAANNNSNLMRRTRVVNPTTAPTAPPPPIRPSPPPPPPSFLMRGGGTGTGVGGTGAAALYHPDFMFCGECTTCQPAASKEEEENDSSDNENNVNNSLTHSHSSSSLGDFLSSDDNESYCNEDEYNNNNFQGNTNSNNKSHNVMTVTTLIVANSNSPNNNNNSLNINHGSNHSNKLVLQALLQPLDGVERVMIAFNKENIDTTTLTVHHHAANCLTSDLCRVLDQAGFPPLQCLSSSSMPSTDASSSSSTALNGTPTTANNHIATTGTTSSSTNTTTSTTRIVKSTFRVRGICCASEVPSIRRILCPLPSVSSVQISIPTQRVYVNHAVNVVNSLLNNNNSNNNTMTAKEIARLLTSQGFPATIIKNGGAASALLTLSSFPSSSPTSITTTTAAAAAAEAAATTTTTTIGRSTFHAVATLHNQDAAKIQSLLLNANHQDHHQDHHQDQAAEEEKGGGIVRIGVNIAESVIYVEHDYTKITASQIQECLAPDVVDFDFDYDSTNTNAGYYYPTMLVRDAAETAATVAAASAAATSIITTASDQQQDDNESNGIAMMDISSKASSSPTAAVSSSFLVPPRSKYVESTLQISNLQTRQHVHVLEKALRQHYIRAQIKAFYPHVNSKTCKVQHNPDLCRAESLVETLSQYGLQAVILCNGGTEQLYLPLEEEDEDDDESDDDLSKNGGRRGAATAAWDDHEHMHLNVWISGIFWVITMFSYIENLQFLQFAGLGSVLFGLPPVAVKAWRTLRRYEFDANCMMLTAAVGALCLGELDEAASVSFLFAVSEYLEARASYKARMALQAICQLQPEHAHVMHPVTRELTLLPAHAVTIGSWLCVRTGDKIATDGIILEGTSQVDESSLTGESMPLDKTVHDKVAGGTMNVGSTPLIVQTTSTAEDSAVARLIRLVEEAQAHTSPTEKMIDAFARAYTPAVLFVAAICCTIPWFWGSEVGRYWTLNGLIIIVIACPCALTISTPVTYAAALAATAQRGIVVKGGGDCLEALGSVETVLLDKTGTITQGKFQILHLQEIGDFKTRREMLELLALLEGPCSHPISSTLVKAAQQEAGTLSSKAAARRVENHCILTGEGVTGVVDGQQVYVGNVRLFERLGMYQALPTAYQGLAQEWSMQGGSVGFVGVAATKRTANGGGGDVDGKKGGICGIFCVTDIVRPEAAQVLASLQRHGICVQMLTGDGHGSAMAVAEQVGIPPEHVHARLLPADKLHHVMGLKTSIQPPSAASGTRFKKVLDRFFSLGGLLRRTPRILFCGDGVNDAPALAVADVGVSMGEGVGTALAMEMSDVTLMDSNLQKLEYVLNMGTRVVFTIQENICMSLACKVLVVILTFAGYMTLLYAIASDVGVMLLVTLNGMKLLPGRADGALARRTRMKQRRLSFQPLMTYDQVPSEGGQNNYIHHDDSTSTSAGATDPTYLTETRAEIV